MQAKLLLRNHHTTRPSNPPTLCPCCYSTSAHQVYILKKRDQIHLTFSYIQGMFNSIYCVHIFLNIKEALIIRIISIFHSFFSLLISSVKSFTFYSHHLYLKDATRALRTLSIGKFLSTSFIILACYISYQLSSAFLSIQFLAQFAICAFLAKCLCPSLLTLH